jgi:hypothetical protein
MTGIEYFPVAGDVRVCNSFNCVKWQQVGTKLRGCEVLVGPKLIKHIDNGQKLVCPMCNKEYSKQ